MDIEVSILLGKMPGLIWVSLDERAFLLVLSCCGSIVGSKHNQLFVDFIYCGINSIIFVLFRMVQCKGDLQDSR